MVTTTVQLVQTAVKTPSLK